MVFVILYYGGRKRLRGGADVDNSQCIHPLPSIHPRSTILDAKQTTKNIHDPTNNLESDPTLCLAIFGTITLIVKPSFRSALLDNLDGARC